MASLLSFPGIRAEAGDCSFTVYNCFIPTHPLLFINMLFTFIIIYTTFLCMCFEFIVNILKNEDCITEWRNLIKEKN